jgi:hypothetical protein
MPMIVMHVGHVRMRVRQGFVLVRMRVRLCRRILRAVVVPVMLVVAVGMGVHHSDMGMRMRVSLGDMQPNAGGHQHSGGDELDGRGLLGEDHRGGGADERRG